MFEITPAVPYTADDLNYNDSASRTSVECVEDARPELAQVTPEGFAAYDTVFVGYPIWWGDAAWPVKTFAAGNDFSGKTVVPFCTSASSGIGSSGDELARLAGTGTWVDGARFAGNAPTDEVASWADGLALYGACGHRDGSSQARRVSPSRARRTSWLIQRSSLRTFLQAA